MSMYPAEMFPDVISYALVTQADINGDLSVEAPVEGVSALVEQSERVVRTSVDEEVVTSHRVSLTTHLPKGTHVWLSATATGERLEVQASTYSSGLAGAPICEVLLS